MGNQVRRRWSRDEGERAFQLRAEGNTHAQIAAALGRTASQVEQFFRYRRLTVEQRERRNERALNAYRQWRDEAPTYRTEIEVRVCPDALADRDYRLSLPPRNLTAAIFGDPAIGYSALERRL